MIRSKRVVSVILAIMLFISPVAVSAQTQEEVERQLHSIEYYFQSVEETICFESDNFAKYAYIIRDNEATLLSIHITYQGNEKIDLILPTTFGGYPATTIGYDDSRLDTTWYINYGEDVDTSQTSGMFPEWDPGLKYISRLIIPEGYETICDYSLAGFYCPILFPKSLKNIYKAPFETLYSYAGTSDNERIVLLPECYFSFNYNFVMSIASWWNKTIVLHSRDNTNSGNLLSNLRTYSQSKEIYVPSHITYRKMLNVFYYFEAAAGDAGETWARQGTNMTLHCAPDSEFLQVFEDYEIPNGLTIITDVTPAAYIEFPEETVNIHVGDVVDLEAKTFPAEAIWTACDYEVSDPSIVKIDEYSGRITALKEGTVTVTAKHCERGFVDTCTVNVVPEPVPGVNEIKPATDTPYYSYGNRDYILDVTGSPSKIQVVRDNGGTTTIDRRRAKVTSNGETETWVVNMRVEAGTHNIRAKYGNKWEERLTPFTVTYDIPPTPKAYSFDLGYKNGIGTFEVVTDPQIIKVQFVLDNGCTLTYSQSYSYVAEDGLRHWVITRKIPANTNYTLKTKLGYTWTTTDLTVTS